MPRAIAKQINYVFCCSAVRTRPSRPRFVEEITRREENREGKDTRGTEKKGGGTEKVKFAMKYFDV